jgi:hypothetical protein
MPRRWGKPIRWQACAAAALLAACGGGDGVDPPPPAADCSAAAQNAWLRDYMREWYFWYRLAPNPDPLAFASVDDYFAALLYTGADPAFPRDRWSGSESTVSHTRFFGEGKTLGFGISVAGVEVAGRPDLPLRVRYVERQSDAAAKGVRRGDQILSLNGRPAADVIASNDFSALSAANEGSTLRLELRGAGGDRAVTVAATVFSLSPVGATSVMTTPGGRRVGYVFVKDMIGQTAAPLDAAFAQFRTAGLTDLVLDLRYNGGGLVSAAADLASYVAASAAGRPFAGLLYNDKRAATNNETFRFDAKAEALDLRRVTVLTGSRTCSASEQVINGLRGVGIEVVAIGDTTCGKPVGFLPAGRCGTTFSAVNFESVNARNEGRYFGGFAPTCPVAEDVTRDLGAADEPLFAAARRFADTGACPIGAFEQPQARRGDRRLVEPGERTDMVPR